MKQRTDENNPCQLIPSKINTALASRTSINPVALTVFIILSAIAAILGIYLNNVWVIPLGLIIASLAASSIKIANQWEKAVVLRLGKLQRVAGPGPFLIIPIIDSVAAWIDQRIMLTSFAAEQALTKDTVPVNVDAVLFWMAWDPEKAALEVADYRAAVAWASQTALREVIGKTDLAEMLVGREVLDKELLKIIDQRTEPWGISVQSVEIRDVVIPVALQDAMSREAQAERERRARIILATAEAEIARKFAEASNHYVDDQVALQLRQMNILYEGLKDKGGLVVVPSDIVESMGGRYNSLGIAALKKAIDQENQENSSSPADPTGIQEDPQI